MVLFVYALQVQQKPNSKKSKCWKACLFLFKMYIPKRDKLRKTNKSKTNGR